MTSKDRGRVVDPAKGMPSFYIENLTLIKYVSLHASAFAPLHTLTTIRPSTFTHQWTHPGFVVMGVIGFSTHAGFLSISARPRTVCAMPDRWRYKHRLCFRQRGLRSHQTQIPRHGITETCTQVMIRAVSTVYDDLRVLTMAIRHLPDRNESFPQDASNTAHTADGADDADPADADPADAMDADLLELLANDHYAATNPEQDRPVEPPLSPVEPQPSAPLPTHPTQPDADSSDAPTLVVNRFPDGSPGAPIPGSHQGSTVYNSSREAFGASVWAPFRSQCDWEIAHWAKTRGPTSSAVTDLLAIPEVRAHPRPLAAIVLLG
jgi:hypothetical protein